MLAKLQKMKQDEGFTLVELLVVIAILGILAGIVVFSIAGITDTGKLSACSTEKSILRTAQEAFFADKGLGNGKYATDAPALQTAKLIASLPTYYSTASTTPFTTYSVTVTAAGTGNGCS
jgi:prepilin-type N-terminal cleavage/methylation domain-containing protein